MKISERLKALEQNQESWKSRLSREKPSTDGDSTRKSLECRRSELIQASDDWRKRTRTEVQEAEQARPILRLRHTPVVQLLNGVQQRNCKSECQPMRIKRGFGVDENEKPTSTQPAALTGDESNNLLSTPRRVMPSSRRLPTRLSRISPINENAVSSTSSPSLKRSFELGEEFHSSNKSPIEANKSEEDQSFNKRSTPFKLPADAFQTPIIGQEHCGVKLRELDTKSPFPEVMLVQARVTKQSRMSVRLISPSQASIRTGSYLLITRKRLIISNSPDSTVAERAKVSQMAYEIIAGKEMACTASRVFFANDDAGIASAFSRIIENREESIDSDAIEEEEEEEDWVEDSVYWVAGEERMEVLAKGQPPSIKYFDPLKILIFDFVTELYIWIGRSADRSLIKVAVEKAEELMASTISEASKKLLCIPQSSIAKKQGEKQLSFGIFRKFSQGIVDCLFRHKFDDWTSTKNVNLELRTPSRNPITPRPWSVPAASHLCVGDQTTPRLCSAISISSNKSVGVEELLKDEQEMAEELANSFSLDAPIPNSLQLEAVDLRHTDENLFTERLLFYKLEGESLQLLNKLEEFNDQSCYVLKWNYRIEREGVRRLNGDQILTNHETGRQRVAFFYWLGAFSSIKDQSKCALALRDHDKARHEHIRVEQGLEPAMFLSLLDGKMVVSG